MAKVIRFSKDAKICVVWDTKTNEAVRCPTQHDMDSLPVGSNLTAKEVRSIEE